MPYPAAVHRQLTRVERPSITANPVGNGMQLVVELALVEALPPRQEDDSTAELSDDAASGRRGSRRHRLRREWC